MKKLLRRAILIAREKGLKTALNKGGEYIHKTYLRDHLPRRPATFNTHTVRGARLGDGFTPWLEKDNSVYEAGIIESLRNHAEDGDHVVIIGGGLGVTAVEAAVQVGARGRVTVYEAAEEYFEFVKETASLNDVADRITCHHAMVSSSGEQRGSSASGKVVDPGELPDCDVLELDCEGAELKILQQLEIRPSIIIVETHGHYDAPPHLIANQLGTLGYEITSRRIAEPKLEWLCKENDIYVLTAKLSSF